jgi:hypothetical protein
MDELVEKAWRIASGARPVGAGDGDTYTVEPATKERMRAAIEAILPAIRAGVIEECAKELDAASATYRGVRERGGLSAEAVKLVLTCEQTADFCAAKVRSLAEKEI